MSLSPIGRKRLLTRAVLFVVNIIVLALAARVNQFQGFFFVADLSPLALSILTLVLLTLLSLIDMTFENPFTGRASFEIGTFGVLGVFWLISNSFSTSRWRHVPAACGLIPKSFPDEITWCKNLQALKSFIWIEWLIILFYLFSILHFTLTQHNLGNKHIWTESLTVYMPHMDGHNTVGRPERNSEFLQFEKLT